MDEILDLTGSVSEGFSTYSCILEWVPRLCLRVVLYDMGRVNIFIIAMYGVMNYSLLVPNFVAFYEKLK